MCLPTMLSPRFPAGPTMHGFAEFLTVSKEFHAAFSDFDWEIGVIVENADVVEVEGIWKATSSGPMPGPGGELPPTNKRINLPFAEVMVGKNGKVVEYRLYFDQAALMQQLGLMPG